MLKYTLDKMKILLNIIRSTINVQILFQTQRHYLLKIFFLLKKHKNCTIIHFIVTFILLPNLKVSKVLCSASNNTIKF